jgi:uncharacterized membrane protein SpoIIM required for sporulation
MILDLERFVREGRPSWDELEARLRRLEEDPAASMSLDDAKRLHFLYQKASSDLARVMTFASEPAIRGHLESLVGRAYGEVHRQRVGVVRWAPWRWFTATFPSTFRRQVGAFWLAVAVTVAGCAFGAGALVLDPESKAVLMPFPHLLDSPSERVAREEQGPRDELAGHKATFSGSLMTHNTKVSVLALALGMTWGVGTLVLIFYNGVILGAVCADYLLAGEGTFLIGWLLPHGSVEIPAILIAGQAGVVLGRAIIGWGNRATMRERLRAVGPDLSTLIGGVAVMLVWAGIVEAFFSQYHEPVLPYAVKIAVGLVELVGLAAFLALAGRTAGASVAQPAAGRGRAP